MVKQLSTENGTVSVTGHRENQSPLPLERDRGQLFVGLGKTIPQLRAARGFRRAARASLGGTAFRVSQTASVFGLRTCCQSLLGFVNVVNTTIMALSDKGPKRRRGWRSLATRIEP